MGKGILVDEGLLFPLLRATNGYIQYLRDPEGYSSPEEVEFGLQQADFLETCYNMIVIQLGDSDGNDNNSGDAA